jgi:hypothetical protein
MQVLNHSDDWALMNRMLARLKYLRRFAFIYSDDLRRDVPDVVTRLTAFHDICPTLQFVQLASDPTDKFSKPTRTQPRDWEWDGMAWVALPCAAESLDIWEQSAIDVAMSGTSGINYGRIYR